VEIIMTTLTAVMTTKEKIEQAQERIKASQLKDELKYQSTYDKNFHDALYIVLHMEIGKEYTFLNSDRWYQPYTITKKTNRIFIANIQDGFIVLNLKQAINYIKGGRPVIEGQMFSTNRQQDINIMLFNYRRYRGKYKGFIVNDCGVVTGGAKTVRRHFGKESYTSISFEYQWVKYPLDNRYYYSISALNGSSPLSCEYYDESFKTEKECLNKCIEETITRFENAENKYEKVINYLKDLKQYYQMGIEVKYITENKWDIPLKDFEVIGKIKYKVKEERPVDEEQEEDEEETPTDDNTSDQLSLF
jgi:hypothetical protein